MHRDDLSRVNSLAYDLLPHRQRSSSAVGTGSFVAHLMVVEPVLAEEDRIRPLQILEVEYYDF